MRSKPVQYSDIATKEDHIWSILMISNCDLLCIQAEYLFTALLEIYVILDYKISIQNKIWHCHCDVIWTNHQQAYIHRNAGSIDFLCACNKGFAVCDTKS